MLDWLPKEIDPGWAAIVGALAGFGYVAYQTRAGLRSIKQNFEEQAKLDRAAREAQAALDRESREHQAELERNARIEQSNIDRANEAQRRKDEAKTLAAALSGELSAAATRFENSLVHFRLQKTFYKQYPLPTLAEPFYPAKHFPAFDPAIYRSNIDRLGLLGPSTTNDVVTVYAIFSMRENFGDGNINDPKMVVFLIDAQIELIRTWVKDQWHVNKRLLAAITGEQDPGPLFFEKQKRDETEGEAPKP